MNDSKRILGLWDSSAIIVGIVVGVGIFRVPAEVVGFMPSPPWVLAAWLLGGIICLLGAFCFAELAASFPQTGGLYIYLRESYGPAMGFLFGWVELVIIRPGSIAAVSFIAAESLRSLLGTGAETIKLLAVLIILVLSVVNILGLRYGKGIQTLLSTLVVIFLVSVVVMGGVSPQGDLSHFSIPQASGTEGLWRSMGLALIPILWTYGGWHENTFLAGETRDPSRLIPRALILSISLITLLYVAVNAIYIYLLPMETIGMSSLVMSDVMNLLLGSHGQLSLDAFVMIVSLAGINGMIMTGSRLTVAVAEDRAVFRFLAQSADRHRAPYRAIILISGLSFLMVAWGTFHRLLFFTGVAVWLFFALVTGSLFILRYKFPELTRVYRVKLYPVIPLIFLATCILLFINTVLYYPYQSAIGLALVLSGLPLYALSRKLERRIKG